MANCRVEQEELQHDLQAIAASLEDYKCCECKDEEFLASDMAVIDDVLGSKNLCKNCAKEDHIKFAWGLE